MEQLQLDYMNRSLVDQYEDAKRLRRVFHDLGSEPAPEPVAFMKKFGSSDMPDFLCQAIKGYVHEFYVLNQPFEKNGFTLDPKKITAHGGCILAAYVNGRDTPQVVLFPPQIMQVDPNADIEVGAWKSQQTAIKYVAVQYASSHAIERVVQQRDQAEQRLERVESEMTNACNKKVKKLSQENKTLKSKIQKLKKHINAYKEEKENQPIQAKLVGVAYPEIKGGNINVGANGSVLFTPGKPDRPALQDDDSDNAENSDEESVGSESSAEASFAPTSEPAPVDTPKSTG